MIPEERRLNIVNYMKEKKTATIGEISKNFNISEITVRRDFGKLSKQGVIKKVYGGASIVETIRGEPLLLQRMSENLHEKRRIAEEASKRISDGNIILIEAGSTCLELIKKIKDKKNIKVITAAPHIINALIDLKRNSEFNGEILCCGGIWQGGSDDFFVGPYAEKFFDEIKIDISFFGIFAIDLIDGWTTPNVFEAEMTKKVIKSSKQIIGITDHTKFNRTCFTKIGNIELLNEIITDSGISKEDLSSYGTRVKITVV